MNRSAAAPGIPVTSQLTNYYQWEEPGSDITVCLNLETIDRLQAEVLRALPPYSPTALEVGGILLGHTTFEDGRRLAFIDDFETIRSERRAGPAYVLSGKDETCLEASLKRHTGGPALRAIGYFRSHTRNGLFLSAEDMRLIDRHFHGPNNTFLLIKPLPSKTCTAGLFFWKDGRIQSEFTDSEVPLMPVSFAFAEAAEPLRAAPAERLNPSPNLRRLARPAAIAGIAAAVTLAVVRYQEAHPAKDGTHRIRLSPPIAQAPRPIPSPTPAPVAATPSIAASATSRRATPAAPAFHSEVRPPAPAPVKQTPKKLLPTAVASSTPSSANRAQIKVDAPDVGTANAPAISLPSAVMAAPAPPPTPAPAVSAAPPPAPAPSSSISPAVSVGPRIIHQATPAVPRGVRHMITSDVEVDVTVSIDDKGRVTGARLASTRGAAAGLLTIEALKAAQLFRFQPAREHERNVATTMLLTFRFAKTTNDKE